MAHAYVVSPPVLMLLSCTRVSMGRSMLDPGSPLMVMLALATRTPTRLQLGLLIPPVLGTCLR